MTNLHIFGDSHIEALEAAARRLADSCGDTPFDLTFYGRDGRNWIDFDWTESDGVFHANCDAVPKTRPLSYRLDDRDALYVFASPLFAGSTYCHEAWRSFCPWDCVAANADMQGVSNAVIECFLANHLKCRLEFVLHMKTCGYRIAVVEPPKPIRRASTLHGIRQDILLATDRIHRHYALDCLAARDVPVIFVPNDTYSDGFTLDRYAHPSPTDTHHGNDAFGARMVTEIMMFARDEVHRTN